MNNFTLQIAGVCLFVCLFVCLPVYGGECSRDQVYPGRESQSLGAAAGGEGGGLREARGRYESQVGEVEMWTEDQGLQEREGRV